MKLLATSIHFLSSSGGGVLNQIFRFEILSLCLCFCHYMIIKQAIIHSILKQER
jgi:hypothetical protein